jgi:hypothetical protein
MALISAVGRIALQTCPKSRRISSYQGDLALILIVGLHTPRDLRKDDATLSILAFSRFADEIGFSLMQRRDFIAASLSATFAATKTRQANALLPLFFRLLFLGGRGTAARGVMGGAATRGFAGTAGRSLTSSGRIAQAQRSAGVFAGRRGMVGELVHHAGVEMVLTAALDVDAGEIAAIPHSTLRLLQDSGAQVLWIREDVNTLFVDVENHSGNDVASDQLNLNFYCSQGPSCFNKTVVAPFSLAADATRRTEFPLKNLPEGIVEFEPVILGETLVSAVPDHDRVAVIASEQDVVFYET